jgi:hypothetical protein
VHKNKTKKDDDDDDDGLLSSSLDAHKQNKRR